MKINSVTISYVLVAVVAIFVVKSLATSWIALQQEVGHRQENAHPQEVSEPKLSIELSLANNTSSSPSSSSQPILHPVSASVAQLNSFTAQAPAAQDKNFPASAPRQQQGSLEGASRMAQLESSPDSAQVAVPTSLVQNGVNGRNANATLPSVGLSVGFPAASVRAASVSTTSTAPVAATAPTASIPAAFGDPAAAGITAPDQLQQVAQIAKQFTDPILSNQVSVPGFSPSSPSYQKAWNRGVSMADATFRQQFGWQAFEAMQQSAAAQ